MMRLASSCELRSSCTSAEASITCRQSSIRRRVIGLKSSTCKSPHVGMYSTTPRRSSMTNYNVTSTGSDPDFPLLMNDVVGTLLPYLPCRNPQQQFWIIIAGLLRCKPFRIIDMGEAQTVWPASQPTNVNLHSSVFIQAPRGLQIANTAHTKYKVPSR
jgi:hypothetical protein